LSRTGLAASNSEARRLLVQGGVTIDGEKASESKASLAAGEYLISEYLIRSVRGASSRWE
jgi:ribosomal protein S4